MKRIAYYLDMRRCSMRLNASHLAMYILNIHLLSSSFNLLQKTEKDIGVWEGYISNVLHNRLGEVGIHVDLSAMFANIHAVHTFNDNASVMLMDYLDEGTLLVRETYTRIVW